MVWEFFGEKHEPATEVVVSPIDKKKNLVIRLASIFVLKHRDMNTLDESHDQLFLQLLVDSARCIRTTITEGERASLLLRLKQYFESHPEEMSGYEELRNEMST